MGGGGAKGPEADDEGDGVNNGDGVEEGLGEDVPDRGDVAIFDVDAAEQEGDAEGEGEELNDEERDELPREAGGDAVDEGEDDDDAEVDGEINEGGGGGGNDDDVFREADLAKEIAAVDDGLDALTGTFGEEVPEDGAS